MAREGERRVRERRKIRREEKMEKSGEGGCEGGVGTRRDGVHTTLYLPLQY